MSLDNIQLSPLLVQQLYKKVLIETTPKTAVAVPETSPSVASLGTNNKNICIVVNEAETAFLPEDDMTLLTGILTACQLSVADVAIVNFSKNENLNYEQLKKIFNPTLLIMFGISPAELSFPLQFPKYQLQKYDNRSFLYSASLKTLTEEKDEKKQLWSCLQKHFFNN